MSEPEKNRCRREKKNGIYYDAMQGPLTEK